MKSDGERLERYTFRIAPDMLEAVVRRGGGAFLRGLIADQLDREKKSDKNIVKPIDEPGQPGVHST